MTKQDEFDFTQFKASFDSAMSPESDFTERMKQMLERESGTVDHQRRTTVIASPSRSNKDIPVPGRRTNPLTIAASILVVLAVVVSSIWVLSGSPLEGEYGSAPSGIATLPADADVTPGADVTLSAEKLPWFGNDDQIIGSFDGILVTQHWNEEDEPAINSDGSTENPHWSNSVLSATDLASGEQLWQFENMDFGSMSLVSSTLVGYRYDWSTANDNRNPDIDLLALDIETGEVIWTQDSGLDAEARYAAPTAPFVARGLVIVVNDQGNVEAWDAQSGESAWETELDPGEGWPVNVGVRDDQSEMVTQHAVTAVAWNNQIVMINGDGHMVVLDPTTGDIAHAFDLDLDNASPARSVGFNMHPTPTGVLLLSVTLVTEGIGYDVFAINPETGNVIWQRQFEGQVELDVSNDGDVAANVHVWKEYPWYLRPFGLVGYSTFQFHWIDGETGEDMLVTERGKLETSQVTLTDGNYACTRTKTSEIICFDRDGTRHILRIEPLGDPVLVDGDMYLKAKDGMYRVELP